jgi:hypothetical protein
MIHTILHLTGSSKKMRFLKYHVGAVIIFGLLYWLQDVFMVGYPKVGKELHLGKTIPPSDSLYYWMWFSVLTQSTVGYGGAVDAQGKAVSFDNIPNNAFRTVNFLQLFSVLFITAQLL